jgi:hypothetical protein
MDFLAHLWLPILISAAIVWIASAVIWMALPHHAHDFDTMPNEAEFLSTLKSWSLRPGNYGFPNFGDKTKFSDPEKKKQWEEGPLGILNVWPPQKGMGANMVLSFLVYLVVSLLIGYLGWEALGPGHGFWKVFQILGTAGILAYSFAFLPNGIWFNQKRRALAMNMVDGIVLGLLTGLVFASLWPTG